MILINHNSFFRCKVIFQYLQRLIQLLSGICLRGLWPLLNWFYQWCDIRRDLLVLAFKIQNTVVFGVRSAINEMIWAALSAIFAFKNRVYTFISEVPAHLVESHVLSITLGIGTGVQLPHLAVPLLVLNELWMRVSRTMSLFWITGSRFGITM